MNDEIKNEKTEVASTIEMNDENMLEDILNTEKNMSNNYSIAMNEASNDWLYDEITKLFKDTQDMQRELYNLLFQKGWYTITKADEQQTTKKYNEYSNKVNELP